MPKEKTSQLEKEKKKDLLEKLKVEKKELANLRVVKASGGAPSKVMKIKQTRRNVARIMTALAIKSLKHYKKEIKDAPPKSIPKQLRAKKTRAIRRALPTTFTGKSDDAAARKKFNRSIKTLKQFKRESNSKPAVFALKA